MAVRDFDGGAAGGGGLGDGGDQAQTVQADLESGQRAQVADAGDLIEEGAGLIGEEVGDTVADAAGIHRQAAPDVGVVGSDEHPPRAGERAPDLVGGDLEFAGAVQIPRRRSVRAEQLEAQSVGQVVGDPRRGERADGAAVEPRGEGGDVLVLDRHQLVADRALGVTVGDAERHRTLG